MSLLANERYWGLPRDRCEALIDPAGAEKIAVTVARAVKRTEDTLLVYLAGHGMVSETGELLIALSSTDPEWPEFTALRYSWIREALLTAFVPRTIVIVDSCFSGRAINAMSEERALIAGQLGINGAYLLTSVPPNSPAVASIGATHTAFTGALIKTIESGIDGGEGHIRLSELYSNVRRKMIETGLPQPLQMGTNQIAELPLVRNVASGTHVGIGRSFAMRTEREAGGATRDLDGAVAVFTIADYQNLSPLDQVDRSLRFADILDLSIRRSEGIAGSWFRQPTTDGELIVLANGTAAVSSTAQLIETFAHDLTRSNMSRPYHDRLRVVLVAHAGTVRETGSDFSGIAVDVVTRIRIGLGDYEIPRDNEMTSLLSETFVEALGSASPQSLDEFKSDKSPGPPIKCYFWRLDALEMPPSP
jgi:hypothetical protein